jgi:hypothetical protein
MPFALQLAVINYLSTCILKYGNVFITWFIHDINAKV